eukprot:TRINITY_DN19675_c0_g1_i1.p1 TRINITY_DN19675_c0_g1~~TRINITY_DN19675_c0_g1_i1.p1  ORF type:complete len:358 (+),score=94.12 TRINITY_DN19675_c0_g1_i1:42-1076(+)
MNKSSDEARVWATRLVYLVGGALYIIGAQEVYYTGAGSMKTFLPPLPYFLGMMMAVLLPPVDGGRGSPSGKEQKDLKAAGARVDKLLMRIAGLEATGYLMTYLGIAYAGSTIYTIVYGSMSLVVALVRWLITKKTVSRTQLLGMVIAVFGIFSTAIDGLNSSNSASIELGVLFTLLGCFAYATEYVFLEEALSILPPQTVLFQMGKYCTAMFFVLFITIGLPHHKAWIEDQVKAHHGRMEVVLLLYTLLVPCSFLKNYAWLGVIKGDGAVATGLMQGCRSCLTFAMSAMLFCSPTTTNQCYTTTKGFATLLVVAGTLIYSFAQPETPTKPKTPPFSPSSASGIV